jgi:hypothetical protein
MTPDAARAERAALAADAESAVRELLPCLRGYRHWPLCVDRLRIRRLPPAS